MVARWQAAGVPVSIRSRPEGREIREADPGEAEPGAFQSALAPKDERYYNHGNFVAGTTDQFQSALAPKDERYPP